MAFNNDIENDEAISEILNFNNVVMIPLFLRVRYFSFFLFLNS